MKASYKCAKIAQSLQHNIRPLFALGLVLLFNRLCVFNLSAATKNLLTNYTFFVNFFMAEVTVIQKLVHSFAEQMNGPACFW